MAGDRTRFSTGNQAARKYTVEDARQIFKRVYDCIERDEDIKYLNSAVKRCGYYVQLLHYLADIYAHDEEVVEWGFRIQSELEERLVDASLHGRVKEATAIFLMKARFNMHETHRFQQVGDGDQDGNAGARKLLEDATPEQLEQIRNAMIAAASGGVQDDDRESSAELAE